ncbi:hypothetical protein GALL_71370 [mine drainage metagenome]|uniref:Uncharacterized protein n=1 Tax=mine drainage metagenome TaxID=410659 RepID=A0A1J5TG22_9ZZZZ
MVEPHSTVSAGIAQGALASSVTLFLGAQVDALIAGLVAAILVSIWLDKIDNKAKAAAAVLLSALLAGYGSPVAAEWVTASVSGIASSDSLRLLLALMIGAISPTVVPIAIQTFGRRAGGGA